MASRHAVRRPVPHQEPYAIRYLRMTANRRTAALLAVSGGTIIIDFSTLDWSLTDVWWTEHDVTAACPYRQVPRKSGDARQSNIDFDEWCHKTYIDSKTGSARLIKSRNGYEYLQNRRSEIAAIPIVEIWTGLVRFRAEEAALPTHVRQVPPGNCRSSPKPLHAWRDVMRSAASYIKKVFSEELIGVLDYHRFPRLKDLAPFNYQIFRRQIFLDLLRTIDFESLVETGAHRGSTSSFLYEASRLPVYTIESHQRYFGYSRMRFLSKPMISVIPGDSRNVLRSLSTAAGVGGRRVFFYLDAHDSGDLPLREELEIIFENWSDAVVMIDDFMVPHDSGYGYGDYGVGKIPSIEYLGPLAHLRLAMFLPAKDSKAETGAKRGCTVVARDPEIVEKIKRSETLRLWCT